MTDRFYCCFFTTGWFPPVIKSKQPRDRKSRNIYIFCTWLTVFAVWFRTLMFRCVNLALCKCEFASYLTSRERKMAAFSFSSLAGNLLEGRRTCGNRAKPLGKFREVSVRFPRVSAPPLFCRSFFLLPFKRFFFVSFSFFGMWVGWITCRVCGWLSKKSDIALTGRHSTTSASNLAVTTAPWE